MTGRWITVLSALVMAAAAQTTGGDVDLRNRVAALCISDRCREAAPLALRLVQENEARHRQSPADTGATAAYADALDLAGAVFGSLGDVDQAAKFLITAAGAVATLECNQSPEVPRELLRTCVRIVTKPKVNLAVLLRNHARVDDQVDGWVKEVVDYRSRMLGPYDHDTMNAVHLRGTIQNAKGDFRAAEALFKTVLEHVGPGDDLYADTLDALGTTYLYEGRPEEALGLLRQALREQLKATHSESLSLAAAYNNLGTLELDMGLFEDAQKNHTLARKMRERLEAPDYLIARSLNNLALDAYHLDKPEEEERLLRESLAKLSGYPPTHPDVMRVNQNLVGVLRRRGELVEARRLGESLLAIYEERRQTTGETHPDAGTVLNSLGLVAEAQGKLAEALNFDQRAIELWSKVSKAHPEVARNQLNAGRVAWRQGDLRAALDYFRQLSDAEAVRMNTVLLVGTEQEKREFRDGFVGLDLAVSFHARNPGVDGALRLAFEDVLRQKGIVTDAMTDQKERLRRTGSGEIVKRLAELNGLLSRCSVLAAGGPDSAQLKVCRDKYAELATEQEALERQFAERLPEGRATFDPLKLEDVQEQLKLNGHALVEFFVYLPKEPELTNLDSKEEPRYVAYVLPPVGPARYVPLGSESDILKLVLKFRGAIMAGLSGRPYDARPARELDKVVMQPVRAVLGGVSQVYVAPDGSLGVIPFAALVGEDGRELIETYSFTYLTSGRDLLRLSVHPGTPGRGDHLFARVAYGPVDRTRANVPEGSCAAYAPRYTKLKDKALAERLQPTMQLHEQWAASEEALKSIVSPRILHISTHGFFCGEPAASRDARQHSGGQDGPETALQDPLLRSGLALAEVNRGGLAKAQELVRAGLAKAQKSGSEQAQLAQNAAGLLAQKAAGDDGFLTAREAADLRLDGTELVVLDACETGVGQLVYGEGVNGLRRAFLLAGARSQVTTLWPIEDDDTLVIMFYDNLKPNMNRSEALRTAQMQRRQMFPHPYFWAGFTFSGDERPLAMVQSTPAKAVAPKL